MKKAPLLLPKCPKTQNFLFRTRPQYYPSSASAEGRPAHGVNPDKAGPGSAERPQNISPATFTCWWTADFQKFLSSLLHSKAVCTSVSNKRPKNWPNRCVLVDWEAR